MEAPNLVADLPTGPTTPESTVLLPADEAIVVAFRKHTLLPLDDCLYVLQATIPQLTRSSLHRCLQRSGISRLPEIDGDKPVKTRSTAIRSLLPHRHHRGANRRRQAPPVRRHPPNQQFAFVQLVQQASRVTASAFLVALVARPSPAKSIPS